MKKIYSLLTILVISATATAQTTLLSEDFSAYTCGEPTIEGYCTRDVYAEGTNVPTFPIGGKVYSAGGMAKLGGIRIGSMKSIPLDLSTDGGNFTISFDVKGWETVEGDVEVKIFDVEEGVYASEMVSYTALASDNLEHKSVSFTGGIANSTFTIAAKRAFIDNVKLVTNLGNVSIVNTSVPKITLVENTLVDATLYFRAKANIQIINANGQVIRTAVVDNSNKLDVAALAKGLYIIKGEVNGKIISQKIIKK